MPIETETVVESGEWSIDRLNDDAGVWYVLRREFVNDEGISIPFDSVSASGSLIQLDRNGQRTATIPGALSGLNKYDGVEVPEEIVSTLQRIGPW